ncbi:conserved hypothetical protein [Histoplasma capsulatum var. duboisii H88]|uniref:Translation initiation factor eIF2B subunit gamma n=2 Tax=Ajellomyces capsulatus TaxID=5037 RepID=F0UFG0_AJEC8|nr:conserved hypothetical protein [Histoplasma capsulatum H143]EGC44120.1 conserved hypothetical protein [Histoplasma capsulatum var. duboisii H88]QSS54904.1 eukaryotic translation initiation factor subunit eIF2B-gamma [Histoplasma capsulatum var. duboisii H88]
MPHASVVPYAGFQALILCGPGVSLNTFTSNPEEFPKALVPIANRPMVWYPLDWCYRMGITNITLITPQSSQPALEAALSQNPHLTSLPSPSPSVLAPRDLTFTTGTSELLRLPDVQACIRSDFMLLPCDLICDLLGESLLEAWMSSQGALDGSSVGEAFSSRVSSMVGVGGEHGGRRGGLGVWYPMPTSKEEKIKGEVADFLAVTPLDTDDAAVVNGGAGGNGSVRASLSKLVYAAPMDTLKNTMAEKKAFLIRPSLLRSHGRVKLLTTYRDAHIYLLPYWVKDMAKRNQKFESVSEDLIGWWAKAEWQTGLGDKLSLREVFSNQDTNSRGFVAEERVEEEIDITAMSTTKSSSHSNINPDGSSATHKQTRPRPTQHTLPFQLDDTVNPNPASPQKLSVPPILAYVHPSQPSAPLIRRVDSSALLLSTSLRLAKLDPINDVGREAASPFAHMNKIAHPAGIAQRCTVTKADCLIAENVTVEEKCVIKECVIGANCHIATGARLTRCLLMDGAVVDQRCQLTGCIIGRRCRIGRESVLKECEVQDGNVVPEETEASGEKFMVFEGLDGDMDDTDMDGDMDGDTDEHGTG